MISFLLTNKWVQYALGGLLICGLLWAVAQHFINVGKEQQKQDSASEVSKQIEQMRSEDRAKTDTLLKGYDDRLKDLTAQKQASDAVSLRIASTLATIASVRTAAAQSVQSTPDSQLDALIASQLGHKDFKQALTVDDKRVIASCLVDKPLCQQENEALKAEVGQDKVSIANREQTIQAWQGKYESLSGYTDRLEGYYAESWNLIPHKQRSAKCLYLWRCAEKKLVIPHPDLLKH